MGTQERRKRELQETRARILDAARVLFATRGVEATTMRAIADRIEYTPTAIYHHFRDKDELLLELVHSDFRALFSAFAALRHVDDPIKRIQGIGEVYVDFGLEHPHHYQLMFMTPKAVAVEHTPEQDAYEFLRRTVAEGIEQDRFLPGLTDSHQLAQVLWAGVHGIVSLPIAKQEPWVEWADARASARLMIDALLRGLVRG